MQETILDRDAESWALGPRKVAKKLDISLSLCHKLIKEGTIASFRLGKRILVPMSAVEELLKKAQ